MKSLVESLFDDDLVTKDLTIDDLFKLEDVYIRERIMRYGVITNLKLGDMYKISLLSKDSGMKVTKDPDSIADALSKIIGNIKITNKLLKTSLYDFSEFLSDDMDKYYSAKLHNLFATWGVSAVDSESNGMINITVEQSKEIKFSFFNIILTYKRK